MKFKRVRNIALNPRKFLKKMLKFLAKISMEATKHPYLNTKNSHDINYDFDKLFPRYTEYDPIVPIWNVTPDLGRCFHRFHLSSPFSPSGRYLGLTRMHREDRPPEPGEAAEIILVDLHTGEQKVIDKTNGWDTQLGSQVQWGMNDTELYYNNVDIDNWLPYGVKLNPITGNKEKLDWTVYDVSPDGKWAVSTDLRKMGNTQAGYGIRVPKKFITNNKGATKNDGVYITDTTSGKTKMIASYKEIVEKSQPWIDVSSYGDGDFYGFHTKWNSHSNRIMLVLRYVPSGSNKRKPMVVTMNKEGKEIYTAIPLTEWAEKGGNHPNWHPDGKHLIMNLNIENKGRRFVQVRYDGKNLKKIVDVPANHGHIVMHSTCKFMLNDAYPHGDKAYFDSTAPLWLIDLDKQWKYTLARFQSVTRFFNNNPKSAKEMRVDPHPVWDSKTHTHVAFNAVSNGTRHVYVADLSKFMISLQK